MTRMMIKLVCALVLSGAVQAETAHAQASAADSARRFLATAVEACDGIRQERETFEQARTRLGLAPRDDMGVSKGSVGRTVETIVQTNLGFRPAPNSGALMCSGVVSGLNLPAEALSGFVGAEIERVAGAGATQEGQTTVTAGGSRQSVYLVGEELMMMLMWDPPAPAGSDEPVSSLFVMTWMPMED